MSRRVPQLLVALVALFGLVAVAIGLRLDGSDPAGDRAASRPGQQGAVSTKPPLDDLGEAERAAASFLDEYVDADGRVHREPEGDTVSEGQAYAMLLALAIDDRERFDLVWTWTSTNMLDASGSLAWHWVDGQIVDSNAATDADLDAIRALLMAADRFDVPAYREAGVALAAALVRGNVVTTAAGPVLLAGPWAADAPFTVNPSYHSPATFDLIADVTGDPVFTELATTGSALLQVLTDDGRRLPSDWATVTADGEIDPSGAPGGGDTAYGYDAFRTLVRLGEACSPDDRALAASLVDEAGAPVAAGAAVANTDGTVQTSGDNPLLQLAEAAAAQAAGDEERADDLLDRAELANDQAPSYYLGAWVALTRVLIDTDLLDPCVST